MRGERVDGRSDDRGNVPKDKDPTELGYLECQSGSTVLTSFDRSPGADR